MAGYSLGRALHALRAERRLHARRKMTAKTCIYAVQMEAYVCGLTALAPPSLRWRRGAPLWRRGFLGDDGGLRQHEGSGSGHGGGRRYLLCHSEPRARGVELDGVKAVILWWSYWSKHAGPELEVR